MARRSPRTVPCRSRSARHPQSRTAVVRPVRLDVSDIHRCHVHGPFQNVEHRFPVHTRRFHKHVVHPSPTSHSLDPGGWCVILPNVRVSFRPRRFSQPITLLVWTSSPPQISKTISVHLLLASSLGREEPSPLSDSAPRARPLRKATIEDDDRARITLIPRVSSADEIRPLPSRRRRATRVLHSGGRPWRGLAWRGPSGGRRPGAGLHPPIWRADSTGLGSLSPSRGGRTARSRSRACPELLRARRLRAPEARPPTRTPRGREKLPGDLPSPGGGRPRTSLRREAPRGAPRSAAGREHRAARRGAPRPACAPAMRLPPRDEARARFVPKAWNQCTWPRGGGYGAGGSSYAWTPGASCPDRETYSS